MEDDKKPSQVLLSERGRDDVDGVGRALLWAMSDMLSWETRHPRSGMHLIRSEHELQELWVQQGGAQGKMPGVDFTKEMVAAIILDKGSYRQAPGIHRIEQVGGEVRIFYKVSRSPWSMINPCSVIKIPRAEGTAVFIEVPA